MLLGSKKPSDLSESARREFGQLCIILGKREKESGGVVTSRGRTRVAILD